MKRYIAIGIMLAAALILAVPALSQGPSLDGVIFPSANIGQIVDCPDCVMPN